MSYYVYILKSCIDNNFYTGLTCNLERRFKEHNTGLVKSTKHRKPFVLVHQEKVDTLVNARMREKFLKSGAGREFRKEVLKI